MTGQESGEGAADVRQRSYAGWAVLAISVLGFLSGCQNASPQQTETAPPPAEKPQSDIASTQEARAEVPEHGEPLGHCGDVRFPKPVAVYLGDKDVTCPMALDLAARIKNEEGKDANGGGMTVGPWNCAFDASDDDPGTALTMLCWQGERKEKSVLFRPTGLDPLPGYHRNPNDFFGGDGDTVYFTTPARKFHCSISADHLGCDSHDGMPPGVPQVENQMDGTVEAPTAITLGSSGPAKFEIFGDPAHTGFDDSTGEPNAAVLNYGQVLVYADFSCTADEKRGVVCKKGRHGFEISSKAFKTQ